MKITLSCFFNIIFGLGLNFNPQKKRDMGTGEGLPEFIFQFFATQMNEKKSVHTLSVDFSYSRFLAFLRLSKH